MKEIIGMISLIMLMGAVVCTQQQQQQQQKRVRFGIYTDPRHARASLVTAAASSQQLDGAAAVPIVYSSNGHHHQQNSLESQAGVASMVDNKQPQQLPAGYVHPQPFMFKNRQELMNYLKKLNEYYAIVGRPRFGKRSYNDDGDFSNEAASDEDQEDEDDFQSSSLSSNELTPLGSRVWQALRQQYKFD